MKNKTEKPFVHTRRKIKYFRRYLSFSCVKILIYVIRLLPFTTALHLGRSLGYLAFYLVRKERKNALTHLKLVFTKSQSDREKIARKMFEHFGLLIMECLFLPKLTKEEIKEMIVDEEIVRKKFLGVFEKEGSFICLTGHLGNWELLGAWGATFLPVSVIAKKIYYPPLNDFVVNFRASVGMRSLFSRDPARKILRDLKTGRALAILPDQDLKRMAGIFVPFFGKLAKTITGPLTLSLLAKAPIVPAYLIRVGEKKFKFIIEEPLILNKSLPKKEMLYQGTCHWTKILEKNILKHPEQWSWNHRRWKTRPQ